MMINKIILGTCFICSSINLAVAAPAINHVSGELTHKGTIIINGTQFGSKVPAAPLIWDDCEDKTVDSDAAVLGTWDEVHPANSGLASPFPTYARTRYRNIPFKDLPAPHSRSTKYLSGGHYQYANNSPNFIGGNAEGFRDVLVTVDAGSVHPTWFATWYYRLDLNWRNPCPNNNNHKYCVSNGGNDAWSVPFAYDAATGSSPCDTGGNFRMRTEHGGCGEFSDYSSHNPRNGWIRYERSQSTSVNGGFRKVVLNNEITNDVSGCGSWTSTRSFTIGGYYRWATDINNVSSYRGNSGGTDANPENNSFRFFDDMYVDTTLSRVMLGNNSNYDDCTILEPQIPSAWNDTSITCSVNLGRLPDKETVYLFVFDDNNSNSIGYQLTTGEEGPFLEPPSIFQLDQQ